MFDGRPRAATAPKLTDKERRGRARHDRKRDASFELEEVAHQAVQQRLGRLGLLPITAQIDERRDRLQDFQIFKAAQGLLHARAAVSFRGDARGRVRRYPGSLTKSHVLQANPIDIMIDEGSSEIAFLPRKEDQGNALSNPLEQADILVGSASIWVPIWENTRDRMKLFGFGGAVCSPGPSVAFTLHLPEALIETAFRSPRGYVGYWTEKLKRALKRELASFGIDDPEFFIVAEWSHSVGLHLHGSVKAPAEDEAFRLAVRRALLRAVRSDNPRFADAKFAFFWPGWMDYLGKFTNLGLRKLQRYHSRHGGVASVPTTVIGAPDHVRRRAAAFYHEARSTQRPLWSMELADDQKSVLRSRLERVELLHALKGVSRERRLRPWVYVEEDDRMCIDR